jgi:hypothetical protein
MVFHLDGLKAKSIGDPTTEQLLLLRPDASSRKMIHELPASGERRRR